MNILIVYAHPNPASFNQALCQTVREALERAGHGVRVKDLYAEGFDPVLGAADLAQLAAGTTPAAIQAEQQHIAWADGLVLVYPIWWLGPPAVLKGWIDRCFTRGFAFEYGRDGMRGRLSLRRALVLTTLGGDEGSYARQQWDDLISRPMIDGTLRTCGVGEIEHRAFYEVPGVSDVERRAMLDEAARLAAGF